MTLQKLDQPALLFYSLIGNDVCSTHPGNASFTTTDEFLNSTLTVSLPLFHLLSLCVYYGLIGAQLLGHEASRWLTRRFDWPR